MLDQITNNALPITQILYPGYELLFMLDNTISHSIYVKDALQAPPMNKRPRGQQLFLCPG